MEKLNKLLEPDNPLGKVFTLAEKHSKVPKLYIFLGASVIVAVYLLFGPGASLLAMLIGFVYPAYRSVFAIESEEKDDDTQWLTYWVVYGFFGLGEFFTDIFLSWIPFYYLLKCGFLVWCMSPGANNGSAIIYKNIVFPYVSKYSAEIDKVIDKSKQALEEVASDVSGHVSSLVGKTIGSGMEAVAKGEPFTAASMATSLKDNIATEIMSGSDDKKTQ